MNNEKFLAKMSLILSKLSLKNITILVRLFMGFGFVFLIMVLLSYITFTFYKNDKEDSTMSVIHQMNSQTMNKIDDYMMDLNSITKLPLINETNEINFIDELETFNETNVSSLAFQKLTSQLFYKIFNYKTYINSVFIFNLNGKSEYNMLRASLYKEYNPKDEKWFRKTLESHGDPVAVSTFILPNISYNSDKPIYTFSMARAIINIDAYKVTGIIMVNNDIRFLESLCQKMLIVPNQRVLIIDREGAIVYDTIKENITQKFDGTLFQMTAQSNDETKRIKINQTDFIVSYNTSEYVGWKVVNIIPVNELNKNINQLRNSTALITFLLILLASLFVFIFSRQIVKPLKKLILLMKIVEKGDFDVKIKVEGNDEIGQVASTFNNMTGRIEKLINEDYINKIKQKDLELQMLQNQINPHFLYNTLESVRMIAEMNRDRKISSMVKSLGNFLRYSISRKQPLVKIKEEIEHLEDYIMLQKVRYENIYEIIVNIDQSLYENVIIKLILQPIVENAIYHGIENKGTGGKIDIYGYREGSNIIFEVIDNGKGMDSNKVGMLNDYINGLNASFTSIGLINVNRRIKLHYGDIYGLEISSTPNIGTKVKVTVPCIDD